jgi:L-rhamnose-H+ transport protein
MAILTGFLFVLIAGFFQGSFVLPMTLTKNWEWEHTWATFSFLGMLVFNWLIALLIIPDILAIYRAVPANDLIILILFGAGWGIGAVLFGLGMDRLGMALGYPVIMGLIASLGALIPLILFFPSTLVAVKGIVLLTGTAVVILGIVLCTIAAKAAGTPDLFAANAVWALFFTIGFIVNFLYCTFLILKRKNAKGYWNARILKNLGWGALMAIMWIGSFYLYGIGAAKLGKWGVVVGWPLFISLSIVVGNLWGLWRGEWKGAPLSARRLLNWGLFVLLIAVIIIAVSNSL